MKKTILLLFTSIIISLLSCNSGKDLKKSKPENSTEKRGDLRVMFYNVENLFDTFDDPEKRDEEFTPEGKKHWDNDKYNQKLMNIFKVVAEIGEWESPEIIGLCEIENLKVLEDLISETPLKKSNYRIIHKESPDQRGIDVAILYRNQSIKPIEYKAIEVKFEEKNSRPSRDILWMKAVSKKDTIHFFVNHWPSRYGGQQKSEPKRIAAAKSLKTFTDSLLRVNPNAKMIIMGDLNDDPDNKSITKILETENPNGDFINLMSYYQKNKKQGSLKYKGNWNYFDQIIISKSLQKNNSGYISSENQEIFGAEWLLEIDDRYSGIQPNRTYWGQKYHGGYSDHLPVYVDLWLND